MTLRQRIMVELEKGPMTARNISKSVRFPEKEVIPHMKHVSKSLRPPRQPIILPSICNKYGFIFLDRRRFSIPSRCPKCQHEGIHPPMFKIAEESTSNRKA